MEDLRLWYETEVFADGEGQQRSWDVRKWAFMQQLSKELSRPLTSAPLQYLLEVCAGARPGTLALHYRPRRAGKKLSRRRSRAVPGSWERTIARA